MLRKPVQITVKVLEEKTSTHRPLLDFVVNVSFKVCFLGSLILYQSALFSPAISRPEIFLFFFQIICFGLFISAFVCYGFVIVADDNGVIKINFKEIGLVFLYGKCDVFLHPEHIAVGQGLFGRVAQSPEAVKSSAVIFIRGVFAVNVTYPSFFTLNLMK